MKEINVPFLGAVSKVNPLAHLLGFVTNRTNRKLIPEAVVRMIRHQVVLKMVNNQGRGNICWELTLMIPLEAFYHHSFVSLIGRQCRVNFYKCGDELPDPHFVSWNGIKSTGSDFHLSEFFGKMKFERRCLTV